MLNFAVDLHLYLYLHLHGDEGFLYLGLSLGGIKGQRPFPRRRHDESMIMPDTRRKSWSESNAATRSTCLLAVLVCASFFSFLKRCRLNGNSCCSLVLCLLEGGGGD